MIDNIRHKSIRKKTASRIAAVQILYLHQFNNQPLCESISIYDIKGNLVSKLLNNKKMTPGSYTMEWNANSFSSGIYIVNI